MLSEEQTIGLLKKKKTQKTCACILDKSYYSDPKTTLKILWKLNRKILFGCHYHNMKTIVAKGYYLCQQEYMLNYFNCVFSEI